MNIDSFVKVFTLIFVSYVILKIFIYDYIIKKLNESNENNPILNCYISVADWITIIENEISNNSKGTFLFLNSNYIFIIIKCHYQNLCNI